jgi:translation elongation factor EF-Ts
MPAHFPVPIQEDFRDLLMDLLGRGVAVSKIDRLDLDPEEAGVIAEYVTDEGSVGALFVVDGPFAIRAGAALSMVPPAVAEESVTKEDVPDHLLDNFREIANIFARLLNGPTTPHLRLQGAHRVPGPVPELVNKLLVHPEFRRDFGCTVEGYGSGRFALLVA